MDNDNTIAEVKPEVSFLFELIREVVAGRVRIPIFQRPYVWRREQMLDLLDSIRSAVCCYRKPNNTFFAASPRSLDTD